MNTPSPSFYHTNDPIALVEKYESPLYIYNENILRKQCKDMVDLCSYPNFKVNYAMKANTNIHLIKIIHEEGLKIDASSQGEVVSAMVAGVKTSDIMFIVNNVSSKELQYAIDLGITISVDSLSQLERYGKLNPGGEICLRFNSGIGGGHHEKVITCGDGTKFGIMPDDIIAVKSILKKYNLKLIGINHHIGSQNWGDLFLSGAAELLALAKNFPDLEFIDLGGGFAIPYKKQEGEQPIDLQMLGSKLDEFMYEFSKSYGKQITFIIEPGRYIVAECGVLLGTVNAVKTCGQVKYAGTDLGFSVFARTTLYDAHHDIEIYSNRVSIAEQKEVTNIVGNQCESGDYIAKNRLLPKLHEDDILSVMDAGAYGYSMASQYNNRPRPAEILIQSDGTAKLIRRRETFFEDFIDTMNI